MYDEIEEEGVYNLIDHNCAHVALRLLAAGLGCTELIVPFFTPGALSALLSNQHFDTPQQSEPVVALLAIVGNNRLVSFLCGFGVCTLVHQALRVVFKSERNDYDEV